MHDRQALMARIEYTEKQLERLRREAQSTARRPSDEVAMRPVLIRSHEAQLAQLRAQLATLPADT